MRLEIPREIKNALYVNENSKSGLSWTKTRGSRAKKDTDAGCLNHKTKYYYIRFNDILYLAHRIIWFLHYGSDPPAFIDHIDRNKQNNKINNLREATQTQQNQNSCAKSNNKSGYKGVRKHVSGKWHAYIKVDNKQISLKYYDTKEEAALAYNEAALKYFGEFAYLNVIPHTHSHPQEPRPS